MMLTWPLVGTMTGAMLLIHAVLFLTHRLFPHATETIVSLATAEVVVWGYGILTSPWSLANTLLWTSNGIVVAAIALGGRAAIHSAR